MTRCLLGIGSNLGDRAEQMDAAVELLRNHGDITVVGVSDWMETAPVGGPLKQQSYLNGAIVIETTLDPQRLLTELLNTERSLGRERDLRWGPRSVDLDLLLYGDAIVNEPGLSVPHPWMAIRKFVLKPAATVAAEMIHPGIGWTLKRLNENLAAQPLVVAVVGVDSAVQIEAIHAAAKEANAEICQLSSLMQSANIAASRENQLRRASLPADAGKSVVSETNEAIQFSKQLCQATVDFLAEPRFADGTVMKPLVFDFWWWETSRSEVAGLDGTEVPDSTTRPSLGPQVSLLVELTATSRAGGSVQTSEDVACGDRLHRGPRLSLPADDLDRLQHDLSAAIQGMQ